ncbi:HypC/HybG/HupF family hydrogenase formation chaperone [Corynebacterium poyangense]|uniref:HypC/HybG/HupF family hydrogenase formation chaperone n=1 Tax=Corynebacterium poyangense TaxID=2684405 RepID=A0A7H0SR62_9CORY|nr:HypC/HybG/HupF family hydrogenase formation chaperone [Corynebacterium poyangense]MBZ8176464.1 HypC/HybG/HupF family hydrogenase formation chaperone [Corynebacterium poyangense]QNQ91037.1 HypC/HybG/HupF family hydrogenase formation chaperone [Corynebacterium poyangense]
MTSLGGDNMCLGVPGQVQALSNPGSGNLAGPLGVAEVDVAGQRRSVSLAYTPEVSVGDWVLISHGFIMDIISEEDAQEILDTISHHQLLRPELLPTGKERLQDVSRRSGTDYKN